jgi:hypothetical protein
VTVPVGECDGVTVHVGEVVHVSVGVLVCVLFVKDVGEAVEVTVAGGVIVFVGVMVSVSVMVQVGVVAAKAPALPAKTNAASNPKPKIHLRFALSIKCNTLFAPMLMFLIAPPPT